MSQLKFIYPDWSAPKHVKALVTTRLGGVSEPPFESLNIGLHVSDDKNAVKVNRQKIITQVGLANEPVWLNQIHGANILDLDAASIATSKDNELSFDGSVTSKKNKVCAIMTADCLPLFLCDEAGEQVALLHVGWRGLAHGIIENGIKLFRSPPAKIIAWAGPCIGADRFEIGVEVRDELGGSASAYRPSKSNKDKLLADLYQLTGERLTMVGVENYSHSDYCTYEDYELFFSYRRDKKTGRMASLIWKE